MKIPLYLNFKNHLDQLVHLLVPPDTAVSLKEEPGNTYAWVLHIGDKYHYLKEDSATLVRRRMLTHYETLTNRLK